MPVALVVTNSVEEIWKSSDGQRVIWEVYLDFKGKIIKAKTFSRAIATVGFTGEVESYEKEGRQGPETFVKQAPKEGYNRPPKDEKAIQAMWAITKAIEFMAAWHEDHRKGLDISMVQPLAVDFFNMVDVVKAGQVDDVTNEPVDEEPVDVSAIKDIFGE